MAEDKRLNGVPESDHEEHLNMLAKAETMKKKTATKKK